MTDINTELKRFADEEFQDDSLDEATGTLDVKGNPRQATVGAAPAQKFGERRRGVAEHVRARDVRRDRPGGGGGIAEP